MSIPLHLVTGFLGSGKTSFLKHFLGQSRENERIAIIQNEFSSVNIDGREIQQLGNYRILEINNGSVFCVCLLGSFIKSLAAFIDDVKPDSLIMEASGMSDPVSLGQILLAPELKNKVYLAHVWSVVDALNFSRSIHLRNRILNQLRLADTIIINKTDLAALEAEVVIDEVKKINPFARIAKATYAQVDIRDLKRASNFFPVSEDAGGQSFRPDLESAVIKTSSETSLTKLDAFFVKIKDQNVRCKGYVRITGGKQVCVQAVFNDFSAQPFGGSTGPTELVILGNFGGSVNLQSLFETYCGDD
ncbi:MAG: GTP-binding protein [Prolixibacteraceae bacterium]